MFIRQNTQTLRFFRTTPAMRCPYLPHRLETKLVTELSGPDAISQHDTLTDAGFRRSHHWLALARSSGLDRSERRRGASLQRSGAEMTRG